jgi:hypothetical protein
MKYNNMAQIDGNNVQLHPLSQVHVNYRLQCNQLREYET